MNDHTFIQVITAIDNLHGAETIAENAVRDNLAACAQVNGPITSFYKWKGRDYKTVEWKVEFITMSYLFDKLYNKIKELHSYELPEIISVPITGGSFDYLEWIKFMVQSGENNDA